MPVFGYKPAVNPTGYGSINTVNSLNQRATCPGRMTEHGHAYSIGARIGRVDALIPDVALAIWNGSNPTTLVGRSDEFTTGTYMLDETDGTTYTVDLQTAELMLSGQFYSLGFDAADAKFGFGRMDPTGVSLPAIAGYHFDEYRRSVSNPTPQDPFGATSSADGIGWLAIWVNYEANVRPDRPLISTSLPANGAALSTLTPVFEAIFRDDNEVMPNGLASDYMTRYQISVHHYTNPLDPTTAVIDWNETFDASGSEQVARRFSRIYSGATLVGGVDYFWECRVQDIAGAWSEWMTVKTFTVATGSLINLSSPSGHSLLRTPGPFVATWTDPNGEALDRVKIEITDDDTEQVVRVNSAWIDIPNIAAGGVNDINVTWSQTGFTQLANGGQYKWRVKGLTVSGIETGWSVYRTFDINAAPTIPVISQPFDGSTISSRPVIYVYATDPDDTLGSGWQVFLRIKSESGVVQFTRNMTYDGQGVWSYQITVTDWPVADTYRVDAYAYDGSVYSNGATTLNESAMSDESIYIYTAGPTVGIGSPSQSETVNSAMPLFDWSFTNQVRFRLRIWESAIEELVYDSGEITETTTAHRPPSGFITDGTTYHYVVDAWNTVNDQGTSVPVTFFTDFGVATKIENFVLSPYRARDDISPTAVLITWNQTGYTQSEFEKYIITCAADPGTYFDVDDEVRSAKRTVAVITSPSTTTFVYYLPAAGVSYKFGISQVVTIVDGSGEGRTTVRSIPVYEEITLEFRETIICDANDGGSRRVVLQYRGGRTVKRNREQKTVKAFGQRAPTVIRTNRFNRTITGEFFVISEATTAHTRRREVRGQMLEIDRMDFFGGPLCYRDGRGRRYFGEIVDWEEDDPQGGRPRRVSITFEQTAAIEEAV